MKKEVLIVMIVILAVALVTTGMYLIDKNKMKNNKEVIFSTWGAKYEPALQETGASENKEKIVISHNKVENIELLDNFLNNTDKNNKNKISDSIVIITYTTEGDEIITTLKYSKEKEQYEVTVDNLADKFAAEENRKIETKIYSAKIYNIYKEIENNYVYVTMEIDKERFIEFVEKPEEPIICIYDKDFENNQEV